MPTEPFLQYGLLGVVLLSIGVVLCKALTWIGNNAVTPVIQGHVGFLEEATGAIKNIRDDLGVMTAIDTELRNATHDMLEAHSDPHSAFATTHTNRALELLSASIVKVAKSLNVDIEDLHEELRRVLDQQRR